MPLVVNVGLNRKASRDYQSAGVSINLSAELDMGLLQDPPRLQAEVSKVYAEAQVALERQVQAMTVTGMRHRESDSGGEEVSGEGRVTVTEVTSDQERGGQSQSLSELRHRHQSSSLRPNMSNGSTRSRYGGPVRPATASQLTALESICRRLNLQLDDEVRKLGLESTDELDARMASRLITALKQPRIVQQRRWS